MRKRNFAIATGLLLIVSAAAADRPTPGDDLHWLAGDWCGGSGAEGIEESWLPWRGGGSVGVSRTMRGDRLIGFEFLRIAVEDGVPTYIAQPGGRAPTRFRRTDGGETWVRFENPAHDFPQRIEYRRDGDRLVASISGPGEGGKAMTIPFEFRRCVVAIQSPGA